MVSANGSVARNKARKPKPPKSKGKLATIHICNGATCETHRVRLAALAASCGGNIGCIFQASGSEK
jgi:hypothetical protein